MGRRSTSELARFYRHHLLPFPPINYKSHHIGYAVAGLREALRDPGGDHVDWECALKGASRGLSAPNEQYWGTMRIVGASLGPVLSKRTFQLFKRHYRTLMSPDFSALPEYLDRLFLSEQGDQEKLADLLEIMILADFFKKHFSNTIEGATAEELFARYELIMRSALQYPLNRDLSHLSPLELYHELLTVGQLLHFADIRWTGFLNMMIQNENLKVKEIFEEILQGSPPTLTGDEEIDRNLPRVYEILKSLGHTARVRDLFDHFAQVKEKILSILEPTRVVPFIQSLHQTNVSMVAMFMDRILGLPNANEWPRNPKPDLETDIDWHLVHQLYGHMQYEYSPPAYGWYRDLFHVMLLSPDDVLMDLGSGYGGLALYAAIVSAARVIGVEILPQRLKVAQQAVAALDLGRVTFWNSHVSEANLQKANIFTVYSSLDDQTLVALSRRLREEAQARKGRPGRPMKVVSIGASNYFFAALPWLRPTEIIRHGEERQDPSGLSIVFEPHL